MGKRLDRLSDDIDGRIVDFSLEQNNSIMCITECCDGYFSEKLDKEEFGEMIDELKELYSKMKAL